MRHIIKHSYSSAASHKASHCPKISSHSGGFTISHHGGSHMSHHGASNMSHHRESHMSHLGGSHLTHHGGSHLFLRRGSSMSHHRGSNMSHHRGSHMSCLGGSHMSHHGGSHMLLRRGSQMFRHGGSHVFNHGGSYLSHHGGSHMSHHGGSHIPHHGGSYMSHYGGHCKASNVHGGSGHKTVSFSKHSPSSHKWNVRSGHAGYSHGSHSSSFVGHSGWKSHGLLGINEKETMQFLNDRLSSYLDKVRSLEQENSQLERNISEWYENNAPTFLPDSSQYIRIIEDLQNQISAATVGNARVVLQIDNARLAADDFRSRYEMELSLTNSILGDVNSLRRTLEGLNRENCDLGMQVQSLQEDLQQMKRNHQEEVSSLRAQLGARVNVELNAAPSVDLNRALSEIREQYENLMERNLSEVESMFQQRSDELSREVLSGSVQLESVSSEIIELRRGVQTLEIELRSQLSLVSALESTLAETQARYASELGQLQQMINNVEAELAQIRCDLERQNQEYILLMNQKNHLEMEIATYKRLLDCNDIQVTGHHMSQGKHGSHVVQHAHHASC